MSATCLFRVDAAPFMGVGHLSRCLALAQMLRARGARVVFICRDMRGGAQDQVVRQGFELHTLPALSPPVNLVDTRQWLCCDQAEDAAATLAVLQRESLLPDWLIVDHYGIYAEWEKYLRVACQRILVIDDLADRHHDCDLLLDQSLRDDNPYAGLVPGTCFTLLGPRYALLREEFAIQRQASCARDGVIGRVLVFFGGRDELGDTLKAMRALLSLGRTVPADIIVGALNVHRIAIEKICQSHPQFESVFQASDMAKRLSRVDLAIGGGGTSSWERLALGVPALLIEQADNQAQNIAQLTRHGVALALGKSEEVTFNRIALALREVMAKPGLIHDMSVRATAMVDAVGAQRVAGIVSRPVVVMRRATSDDCGLLYQWRNSSLVRRFSLNSDEIDLEKHQLWFHQTLQSPDRDLLLGMADGVPVGVVRFDVAGTCAVLSIYLVPAQLGQGWGGVLLQSAERWLARERSEVCSIEARVLDDNVTSRRMFEALGYQLVQDIFTKRFKNE